MSDARAGRIVRIFSLLAKPLPDVMIAPQLAFTFARRVESAFISGSCREAEPIRGKLRDRDTRGRCEKRGGSVVSVGPPESPKRTA